MQTWLIIFGKSNKIKINLTSPSAFKKEKT